MTLFPIAEHFSDIHIRMNCMVCTLYYVEFNPTNAKHTDQFRVFLLSILTSLFGNLNLTKRYPNAAHWFSISIKKRMSTLVQKCYER